MIKIGTALFEACEELERERGISKDVLIASLCDAMVAAYLCSPEGKYHLSCLKFQSMLREYEIDFNTYHPDDSKFSPSFEETMAELLSKVNTIKDIETENNFGTPNKPKEKF